MYWYLFLKFKIVFEKRAIYGVRSYKDGKEYLSTFKSLKGREKARLLFAMYHLSGYLYHFYFASLPTTHFMHSYYFPSSGLIYDVLFFDLPPSPPHETLSSGYYESWTQSYNVLNKMIMFS